MFAYCYLDTLYVFSATINYYSGGTLYFKNKFSIVKEL